MQKNTNSSKNSVNRAGLSYCILAKKTIQMRTKNFNSSAFAATLIAFSLNSCIDNNNKDDGRHDQNDSNYENEAPTYNKAEDDIQKNGDTLTSDKRVPKDPVEIQSKGNASSK